MFGACRRLSVCVCARACDSYRCMSALWGVSLHTPYPVCLWLVNGLLYVHCVEETCLSSQFVVVCTVVMGWPHFRNLLTLLHLLLPFLPISPLSLPLPPSSLFLSFLFLPLPSSHTHSAEGTCVTAGTGNPLHWPQTTRVSGAWLPWQHPHNTTS